MEYGKITDAKTTWLFDLHANASNEKPKVPKPGVQVEGMLTSWPHYHLTPNDIENAVWTTAVYANEANMGDLFKWLVGGIQNLTARPISPTCKKYHFVKESY